MDPLQEQIDAFYDELYKDPEFLKELEKILQALVKKYFIDGEPFDPKELGWW
jgi:hypothetical protein